MIRNYPEHLILAYNRKTKYKIKIIHSQTANIADTQSDILVKL